MRAALGVPIAIASLVASVGSAPRARAEIMPTSLAERIVEADAIAVGRIAALEDEWYSLAIEKWIHGDPRPPTLRVRRFADRTVVARPVPYATGQRMLVFLEGGSEGWRVIGSFCEGEALLVDGKARVIQAPLRPADGVYPEDEFVAAVASYRALRPARGSAGSVTASFGASASCSRAASSKRQKSGARSCRPA